MSFWKLLSVDREPSDDEISAATPLPEDMAELDPDHIHPIDNGYVFSDGTRVIFFDFEGKIVSPPNERPDDDYLRK